MNKKPKLLIWSDSPTVPTGFGVVAKNLFSDLYKKYDVDIVAINYHGDEKYDTKNWFLYPAQKGNDLLGLSKLIKIAEREQPEKIILFQDIFQISKIFSKLKEVSPKSKIIIYFPIDGEPVSIAWKEPIAKSDVAITYTDFARESIFRTFPDLRSKKKIYTLDHGVDSSVFKPLSQTEIRNVRQEHQWSDNFVVVNVNRFQPRKGIFLTLRAFALFTKGYKICKCGNWYLKSREICDLNGCSETHVESIVNGVPNAILYLHMSPHEQSMGPGPAHSLQAQAINAGFVDEDLLKPNLKLSINATNIYENPVSEEELNKIYNAANVNLTTTLGEGFGFSLAESMAAGTKSIAPNNSAIPEVLGNTGHLIDNVAHFSQAMDNSLVRPIVDVRGVVTALRQEYNRWKDSGQEKEVYKKGVKRAQKDFQWGPRRDFIKQVL